MALQGNPFLGKLKIPVPDLTNIPAINISSETKTKERVEFNSKNKENINTPSITSENAPESISSTLGDGTIKPEIKTIIHQQIASDSPAIHQQTTSKTSIEGEFASKSLAIHQQTTECIESRPIVEKQIPLHQQIASASPALPPALHQQTTSESPGIDNRKGINHRQIASNSHIKSPAESLAIHQHTNANSSPNIFLQGIQKKVVEFIYSECRTWATRTTRPIPGSELAHFTGCDIRTVKNAMDRLVDKKIINRIKSYPGRLGATIYELPESTYKDFLDFEKRSLSIGIAVQSASKPLAESPAKSPAPVSSSSSVLNTSITTTEEPKVSKPSELPEEWREIDFSCLESVRFTEHHLLQIYQCGKVSAEVTQESIYELHHDLTVNQNKSLRNPRNVLLSLLKKGTPYTAPGYEPEYLKAERRCLEEQKRRQGELARIREEQEQLKNAPTQQVQQSAFQSWMAGLSAEQKRQYAPAAKVEGGEMQKALLKTYWESHVAEQGSREVPVEESREWIRKQIDQSLGISPSEV